MANTTLMMILMARIKKALVIEKSKVLEATDYTKFRIKSDLIMLKYKKKEKINYTNAILFNHDSVYRNKKFLLPRVINAIIEKDYTFLNDIIKANIFADFSHADDICNALYKIMFVKTNLDKLILSSGKSTSVNDIIQYILKKNKLRLDINLNQSKPKRTLIGNNIPDQNDFPMPMIKTPEFAANEIYKGLIIKNQ